LAEGKGTPSLKSRTANFIIVRSIGAEGLGLRGNNIAINRSRPATLAGGEVPIAMGWEHTIRSNQNREKGGIQTDLGKNCEQKRTEETGRGARSLKRIDTTISAVEGTPRL